jgi:YTV
MRNSLRSLFLAGLALPAAPWSFVQAQVCCEPAYRVQSRTIMEEHLETRYRVVYRDEFEEQEITSQRPVLRTRIEKRPYTVTTPVTETSTVEEKYTILKPITKREWEDRSYQETTYVTETAEREEAYTTYQPVTETQYQTQQYVVQRPVTETQLQTQQYTTYQPVTTMQTAVVDQGQYVAQQFYQPGDVRYGLRYQPGGLTYDPTGMGAYRRGGFGWVPYTAPGQTFCSSRHSKNQLHASGGSTTGPRPSHSDGKPSCPTANSLQRDQVSSR